MNGLLVRVGVDQAFGHWNGPVDPDSLEFVYVPIPDAEQHSALSTPYAQVLEALERFPDVRLPDDLHGRAMHLDPDFERLTYGDNGARRGSRLRTLEPGDFIAFYAALRPTRPIEHRLLYAIIGYYDVREVVSVTSIPEVRWGENAHTRRREHSETDVVVRAEASSSGRLRRCIPIGEWRDRSYRVRRDVLDAWGGLSCKNGYLQRSGVPPRFESPARFSAWFREQGPELVRMNNPSA